MREPDGQDGITAHFEMTINSHFIKTQQFLPEHAELCFSIIPWGKVRIFISREQGIGSCPAIESLPMH